MKSESNLEKVLNSGQFAVTAELGPPRSCDGSVVEKKAEILKGYADAINITDCQTAIVRMSSISSAVILMRHGLEPVVQMTCRDRNRIGIQSDILGAAALGVRNILCLTGDHQKFGDHPQSKGVFDLDSIQLISVVKTMRDEKKLLGGEEMAVAPRLFVGAAENPFADPFEARAPRLGIKVRAGADFIQTQIVYNVDKFSCWMEEVRKLGIDKKVYILAGVTPLKSAGMAKYMKNNVPGLDIPEALVERMARAKEQGKDPKEEGIEICVEVIKKVREIEGVAGVHIMAIGWEEAVPEIVKRAGLYPRP
ncbi:MAG: methylenetetrahydrofolate reductase [Actinomycetota bacterium]